MLLTSALLVAPIGPTSASTSTPHGGEESARMGIALGTDPAETSPRPVGLADAATWPEGVVTWHADVPRRYRWSVRNGVRAWSRTTTGIRLERRPASEAELLITVGETGGPAAIATVGYQTRGRNTLIMHKVPISGWIEKQVYGRVVAHELGHVLGLRHSAGHTCGLMEDTIDAHCVPPTRGARFACRWVGRAVSESVAIRYGGEFSAGRRLCRLRTQS